MKEFMWKSIVWVVKRHGDILVFATKSQIGTRWRTVTNFINNPSLNPSFRQLLADTAQELEASLP